MNRLLFLLALVLPLVAPGGHAAEYTSKRCSNLSGLYCNGSANATCCGATLSSASSGAALTDTGVDGEVSTTLSSGTLYGCVHPEGSVPTAAQLIAGASPCTSAKSISSPSAGANTFTTSNSKRFAIGTPGASYAASYLHDDGSHRFAFQIRTTAPFTAPAGGGGGGSDLAGLVYVVKDSTGSDSNSGLAPGSAWKTLAKVNNSVTTRGADVCLMTGEVWEDQQLRPDWNGDAGDLGRIGGCYEYAGGLYWLNEGPEAGQHDRPEINGTWESACRTTNPVSCVLDSASSVPTNTAAGLVDFGNGTNYMHLTDVDINDSAGRGIDGTAVHHLVFERVYIDHAAYNSWILEGAAHHNVVAGMVATYGANCEFYENIGRLPSGFVHQNCGTSAQPSCIKVSKSDNAWTLLQGVFVDECSGESFGFGRSSHVWVDQSAALHTGVSYYGDHANQLLITRNIMGGEGPTGGPADQSGQALALEPAQVSDPAKGGGENYVVANIAVSTEYGFGLRNMNSAAQSAGLEQWGKFFFNTSLYQTVNSLVILGGGAGATGADNNFVGNLSYGPEGNPCDARTANGDWSANFWPVGGAVDADCAGSGDVAARLTFPHTEAEYDVMTLAQATGTWSASDFVPLGSSAAHLAMVTPPSVPAWASDLADSSEWDFARTYVGGFGIPGAEGCDGTLSSAQLAMDFTCTAISGTSAAGAVQGAQAVPQLNPITVSANGRNFEVDGAPWYWLADTGWKLVLQTTPEIDTYLADRADRGFRAIQIMGTRFNNATFAGNTYTDFDTNEDGELPFTSISPVTLNEDYWSSIDYIVDRAASLGLYVAVTVMWGPVIDEVFTADATGNAKAYALGAAIGARYADRPNVVYYVAGEYQKIAWQTVANDDNTVSAAEQALIDNIAQGIADNKNASQLISIHSNAGMTTEDLHGKTWLSFHQLQSWSSLTFTRTGMDTLVGLSGRKPAMNTEGGYEDGTTAEVGYSQNMTPFVVRKEMYLQAFGGSAGFSYGHWNIWQFNTGWENDLSAEGGADAVLHAQIMEDIDFAALDPAQSIVVSGAGTLAAGTYNTAMANAGKTQVAVYSSNGTTFSLNLNAATYSGSWINPRTGATTAISSFTGTSSYSFDPPGSPGTDNDWVLSITSP